MFMPPIPVASTHYLFVILKYLSHVDSHYKTSRSQTPLPSHYLLPICSDPSSDNDSFVIVKKSPTFISKPWWASKVSLSLDGFTASLRIFIYLFLTPNLNESAILNQMVATLVLFSDSRSPYDEDLDREDFMNKTQVSNNYRAALYIFWQNTNWFVLKQSY